jgi:hypothetical protein
MKVDRYEQVSELCGGRRVAGERKGGELQTALHDDTCEYCVSYDKFGGNYVDGV